MEKNLGGEGEKLRQLSREKSACVRSYICRFLSRLVVGLFHFSAICILNYFQSFNSSLEKVLDIPPFFVISSMAYFFGKEEESREHFAPFSFLHLAMDCYFFLLLSLLLVSAARGRYGSAGVDSTVRELLLVSGLEQGQEILADNIRTIGGVSFINCQEDGSKVGC